MELQHEIYSYVNKIWKKCHCDRLNAAWGEISIRGPRRVQSFDNVVFIIPLFIFSHHLGVGVRTIIHKKTYSQ